MTLPVQKFDFESNTCIQVSDQYRILVNMVKKVKKKKKKKEKKSVCLPTYPNF